MALGLCYAALVDISLLQYCGKEGFLVNEPGFLTGSIVLEGKKSDDECCE
jgi:hypothetical protein